MSRPLQLDGSSLTLERLSAHFESRHHAVDLTQEAWERVGEASSFFDAIQKSGAFCYGVNTGFGDLIDFTLKPKHQERAQRQLVLSHAAGAKSTLSPLIARAIFLLRLNCFAKGASGLRPETLRTLLALYNHRAYPEIFATGSLGASGDLAPLAHLASFSIGQGYGYLKGKRLSAASIFKTLDIQPLKLSRKEGLSIINGTCAMTAIGALAIQRLRLYVHTMLLGMSLLLDVCRLSTRFLASEAFLLKPHPGATAVARFLRALVGDSAMSTPPPTGRALQSSYSFRCAPFILGPLHDSLNASKTTLEIEINSANDNPLYIPNMDEPYHGGHFHGQPVAVALDQLRVAAVHLTGVIDRQLDAILDPKRGMNLPPFLSPNPSEGDTGLAGAQYLVTSLHVENKMLASPFSPLTIPTNGDNQDYVSLGMQSALATLEMAENTKIVLSVYLLAALQAAKVTASAGRSPAAKALLEHLENLFGGGYCGDLPIGKKLKCVSDDAVYASLCSTSPPFWNHTQDQ